MSVASRKLANARVADTVGDVVMKKLWTLIMVATLAGVAFPVSAQDAPAPAAGGGGGDATSYDFEDDLVQGDLVRPDGENLMVRRRGARESLIRDSRALHQRAAQVGGVPLTVDVGRRRGAGSRFRSCLRLILIQDSAAFGCGGCLRGRRFTPTIRARALEAVVPIPITFHIYRGRSAGTD